MDGVRNMGSSHVNRARTQRTLFSRSFARAGKTRIYAHRTPILLRGLTDETPRQKRGEPRWRAAAAPRWWEIPRDNGWVIATAFANGEHFAVRERAPLPDGHFCDHSRAKFARKGCWFTERHSLDRDIIRSDVVNYLEIILIHIVNFRKDKE